MERNLAGPITGRGGDRGIRWLLSCSPSVDKDNGSSIDQKHYASPFKLKWPLFLYSPGKIFSLLEILIFPFFIDLSTGHNCTCNCQTTIYCWKGRDGRKEFSSCASLQHWLLLILQYNAFIQTAASVWISSLVFVSRSLNPVQLNTWKKTKINPNQQNRLLREEVQFKCFILWNMWPRLRAGALSPVINNFKLRYCDKGLGCVLVFLGFFFLLFFFILYQQNQWARARNCGLILHTTFQVKAINSNRPRLPSRRRSSTQATWKWKPQIVICINF